MVTWRRCSPIGRPVPLDVAAATTLAAWLLDLAPGRPPEAMLLRLRSGVRAILTQPRPRLTVVELVRDPLPLTLVPAAPAAMAPAAGPPRPIPIPVSRPPVPGSAEGVPQEARTVEPLAVVAAVPQAQPQNGSVVTVSARVAPSGLELRFRWNRAVLAAV